MGSGTWTSKAFCSYTTATKGVTADAFTSASNMKVQEVYTSHSLHHDLDPKGVMRECLDTEEHPCTIPVILALDVTGSMGNAAVKVAQKLNNIMTDIYTSNSVKDIEFCIMGIGDLGYDRFPIQISQFESDIRIAEHLDKIYFEGGGGGNSYESYTSAWWMGLNHCKLDCWNRGKKGIIITMGDELPNPYLPGRGLSKSAGVESCEDVNTEGLLEEAQKKFDIYHISIDDEDSSYWRYKARGIDDAWRKLLGENYKVSNLDTLANTIVDIIVNPTTAVTAEEVSW